MEVLAALSLVVLAVCVVPNGAEASGAIVPVEPVVAIAKPAVGAIVIPVNSQSGHRNKGRSNTRPRKRYLRVRRGGHRRSRGGKGGRNHAHAHRRRLRAARRRAHYMRRAKGL